MPPQLAPVLLLTVLLLSRLLQDHHKPVTSVPLMRLHIQSLLNHIRQPIITIINIIIIMITINNNIAFQLMMS